MCNGYIDSITLTSFLVSVRLVDPLFFLSTEEPPPLGRISAIRDPLRSDFLFPIYFKALGP